eukprot:GFKZ01005412.1.p1 GENE.GFKZ01005412.1~~GFKZ01005412.1.p1  ORF type:complete len:369 (+),score=16.12 GFKZ01005412.1:186-1292(+)
MCFLNCLPFLILILLAHTVLSQSYEDGYVTLYRDHLGVIRSDEFGATNGPDSQIFEFPIFCLQCEGYYCEHNYLESVSTIDMPSATRLGNQTISTGSPFNSSVSNFRTTLGNNTSVASRSTFQSYWVGQQAADRAICPDGTVAAQVGYENDQYRLGCNRLASNLRADPADTREKIVTEKSALARFSTLRQTDSNYQQREAVCDNGYYIWGLACVDDACDYFKIICIRVLVRTGSADEEEPMNESDTRVCNSRVCCPLSCGSCGGTGCDERDGGRRNCCESDIRLFGSICEELDDAPCVLSPEYVISTSIDESYLQHCNGHVCCAPSCEQCGGNGCGSFDGGAENCCASNIVDAGKICRNHEDFPCIMP